MKQNVHLEHLEDYIWTGVDGTRSAINFLRSIRNMLYNGSPVLDQFRLSTKWDGAPAIVFGYTNTNGYGFFVSTKSALNKLPGNRKLCFNIGAIDLFYPVDVKPELNRILKTCFRYLKNTIKTGIYQADLLYTRNTLSLSKIDGRQHWTFTPNLITYAIPTSASPAIGIVNSEIGLAIHTSYKMDNDTSLVALPAIDHSNIIYDVMKTSVYYFNPEIRDISNVYSMKQTEYDDVTKILSKVGKVFYGIDRKVFDLITNSKHNYKNSIQLFINKMVKSGDDILKYNGKELFGMYVAYAIDAFDQKINSMKTRKAKARWKDKQQKYASFLERERIADTFTRIFDIYVSVVQTKTILLNHLAKIESTKMFINTPNGMIATGHEGFVAKSKYVMKLVDRMTFSHHNFNVQRDWLHGKPNNPNV